jgi:uncharacterized protein
MNAKSERFEMRIEPTTLEKVDQWREGKRHLASRADAIRALVDAGLERTGQPRFSDGEKLIALMLCDLFKHFEIDGGVDPDFVSEAIYGGHYWAFDWEYQGIFHEHEDRNSAVGLTVDVLDMWSFLESGYEALSDEAKASIEKETGFSKVRFIGFDGNNETEHLSIARFMIGKMDRFQSFAGRDLNSHCPVIHGYRQMLQVFEPIRTTLMGRELNTSEIIRIMKARFHT